MKISMQEYRRKISLAIHIDIFHGDIFIAFVKQLQTL